MMSLVTRLAEIHKAYEGTHPYALWYWCRPSEVVPANFDQTQLTFLYAVVDLEVTFDPTMFMTDDRLRMPAVVHPESMRATLAVQHILELEKLAADGADVVQDGDEEEEEEEEDEDVQDDDDDEDDEDERYVYPHDDEEDYENKMDV
jgi:hypothetical protein